MIALSAFLGSTAYAALPAKPNVLFILLDDIGSADLGVYGGTTITTPELDQIAAEGRRFTNFYVNAPVCSPTRMGLMTGRYPTEFGVRRAINSNSGRGIPSDALTLAEFLDGEGYATGHFGKWHLGRADPLYEPINHGFDTTIVTSGGDTGYHDPTMEIDNTSSVLHTGEHLTDVTTDYAINFITSNAGGPFFANVWYNAAHAPFQPKPEWAALYPDSVAGRYSALLSHVDDEIGRLMDTLDNLMIADDTLVFILSDNGGSIAGINTNAPYRGLKIDVLEGGIRSPLLVRAPNAIPAGTTSDAIAVGFDLFPTIADMLGVDLSAQNFPGEVLTPAIMSGSPVARGDTLFWETKDYNVFFESLTYELNRYAVRKGDWKLVRHENDLYTEPFLYDLSIDSTEQNDVAGSNPAKVAELEAEYRAWRLDTTLIAHQYDKFTGNSSQVGDDLIFGAPGGTITLAADRRFNVSDADLTFRAGITLDSYSANDQGIVSYGTSWELYVLPDGRVEVLARGEGGGSTILTSSTALVPGVEYDIVFTVFGWRDSNSTLRLFVNGIPEAETNDIPGVDSDLSATVSFGRSPDEGLGASRFLGTIADPECYLLALNQSEIGGDADGDTIENIDDNCPLIANGPAQAGVPGIGDQSDFDTDGAGDACDDDDDEDGLLDTVESNTGTYVDENDTGTNPYNEDSDGDGATDGDEVNAGSDPTDPLSTPAGFTDEAAFLVELNSQVSMIDFDLEPANSVLSSQELVATGGWNGVSVLFPPPVTDVLASVGGSTLDLLVIEDTGDLPTLSGTQAMGTDDPLNWDSIVSGTDVQFTFPTPLQAFGLYLVTPEEPSLALFNRDVQLAVSGLATIRLQLNDRVLVATRDSVDYWGYFLGLISEPSSPFSSATLSYGASVPDGAFLFTVDDVIAVPEPEGSWPLIAGAAGLWALGRVRRRRGSNAADPSFR